MQFGEMNTGSQGYPRAIASFSGSLYSPRFKAVVGSRATTFREPSQGWEASTLSELCWVPRDRLTTALDPGALRPTVSIDA